MKSLDLDPQLAEGVHQSATVLPVRRDPLILAILFSYPFWPVVGVLECFRHPGITSQGAQEGPGLGLIWLDHGRPVWTPYSISPIVYLHVRNNTAHMFGTFA